MPLRKLEITIDLPNDATGQRAKAEHARLIKSILFMLENREWAGFCTPLYDTQGNRVGHAVLVDSSTRKAPNIG